MRRGAFSLVELLIVVALLLILTTMYWGSSSASHKRTMQEECQQNLQKLSIAMQIYGNDHAGKFPVVASAQSSEEALDPLVPHYTVDTSLFICPASSDKSLPSGESLRQHRISYAYYMGRTSADGSEVLITDAQVDNLPKKIGQAVFSTTGKAPGNNHQKDGGNLLYGDGHVEVSPPNAAVSLVLTQGVVLLNPKSNSKSH
jgi:prepilin-type N-terminal cleavage/methylation domain-containing protein/prepilin-type processing-associated H-X9-DG protein